MDLPSTADLGSYELLTDFKLDFADVQVLKLRSRKTGLQVVLGHHQAPIANAYFLVATEAFDDKGLPHTLEHLTFLGSKAYPYKGVLDNLASRVGADGTSAWTGVDHTAYTISCAGSEGLLRMLPVFLDHILHPTLTEAGFITEVYHINGRGEEGGVVFSEMQGKENNIERALQRNLNREINPSGSAYRSVTGGLVGELRKLDIHSIRDYHAKYYKPWNICLHLDGSIPILELLKVLNDVVDPMISANSPTLCYPPSEWTRPFVETVSAPGPFIEKNKKHIFRFMEDDESAGEAIVGWNGPATGNHLEKLALRVLAVYLSDSQDSPLYQCLINKSEPDCTSLTFEIEDGATFGEIDAIISGIPHKDGEGGSRLHQIDVTLVSALRNIKFGEDEMARIKIVIERQLQMLRKKAEDSVTGVLLGDTLQDFLYGDVDGADLKASFDIRGRYTTLLSWTGAQWISLLQRYFLDSPAVTIIGEPSRDLARQTGKEYAALIEDIKAHLGQQGLAAKAEQIRNAEQENNREIPSGVYDDVPPVDASQVEWIRVQSASSDSVKKTNASAEDNLLSHLKTEQVDLPYLVHYAHVSSNFITIRAMMDTSKIAPLLRPYVALYLESFFSLAVKRGDELRSHEQVAADLAKITVSYEAKLSLQNSFHQVLQVALVIEPINYAAAIRWLRDLLTGSVFGVERISAVISKLVQSLPETKRDATEMTASLINALVQDEAHSTAAATGIWRRLSFIPQLEDEMADDPLSVLGKLSAIRDVLTDPANLRLSVAGDILALEKPRGCWTDEFIKVSRPYTMNHLPEPMGMLTELGISRKNKAVILPLSSMDGSEASLYARGPQGWTNGELAACKVAASVLHATESFLWKGIRGAGLAYHTEVRVDEESGGITFRIWSSPNAVKAIAAARDIVAGLAKGDLILDENAIAAGKGALLYSYAEKQRSASEAAFTVMVNEVYKGVPAEYNAQFLAVLGSVTVEDVKNAMIKYLVPLFDPASSIVAITCAPGLTSTVREDLKSAGYEVEAWCLP